MRSIVAAIKQIMKPREEALFDEAFQLFGYMTNGTPIFRVQNKGRDRLVVFAHEVSGELPEGIEQINALEDVVEMH